MKPLLSIIAICLLGLVGMGMFHLDSLEQQKPSEFDQAMAGVNCTISNAANISGRETRECRDAEELESRGTKRW